VSDEQYNCTICREPIADGYMYGDGDGSGRRFAHPRCYHRRALQSVDPVAQERAERWLGLATRYPSPAEVAARVPRGHHHAVTGLHVAWRLAVLYAVILAVAGWVALQCR